MSVGNINDIFSRSQKINYSNENSIPLVPEAMQQMTPPLNFKSGIGVGASRPVVGRRSLVLENLPLVESATTFSEQANFLTMNLKAKLNKPNEVQKLVSEWIEVIIDENSNLTDEFRNCASSMSKSELIELFGVIVSKLY